MKARMATLLSLAGVLTAGSAAALVNTQVLQGGNDALADSGTTEATLPPAGVAPAALEQTTVPGTEAPSPETTEKKKHKAKPTTTTTDPTAGQKIFQVGESGLVTLQIVGDQLVIVNATASPGWTVVTAENPNTNEARITFRSSSVEVVFSAGTAFGQIGTDVTARELGYSAPAQTYSPPPQTAAPTTPPVAPDTTTEPPTTPPPTTEPTTEPPTTAPHVDDDDDESEHEDEHEDDDEHEDEHEEEEDD